MLWATSVARRDRLLQAIAMSLTAGGAAVVATVALDQAALLITVVALLVAMVVVVVAPSPRASAIVVMAVGASMFTWTGLPVLPGLSVGEAIPFVLLLVSLVPGVAGPVPADKRQLWVLAVPVVMTIGGVAAAMEPGSSFAPLVTFGIGAVSTVFAIHRLRPSQSEANILLVGMTAGICVSTVLGLALLSSATGRAYGLTAQPNQFAMFAVLAIPLVYYLHRAAVLPGAAVIAAEILLVLGVLDSGSRSGLLALSCVLLIALYRRLGIVWALLVAGLVIVLGSWFNVVRLLSGASSVQRITEQTSTQASDTGRETLMLDELRRIGEGAHAIVGTGFSPDRLPHNVFLLVWGGMGLVGLMAFGALVCRIGITALNRHAHDFPAILAVGATGFLLAVSLNNLVGAAAFWLTSALALLVVPGVDNHRPMAVPRFEAVPTTGTRAEENQWI
jgi:hypothetical protein